MRPLFPTFRPGLSLCFRAALLLIAIGAFGACDRHPATEVPENYGHGSTHERVTPDHQPDSSGKRHFSDTAGMKDEEGKETHETPAATPIASPGGKVF